MVTFQGQRLLQGITCFDHEVINNFMFWLANSGWMLTCNIFQKHTSLKRKRSLHNNIDKHEDSLSFFERKNITASTTPTLEEPLLETKIGLLRPLKRGFKSITFHHVSAFCSFLFSLLSLIKHRYIFFHDSSLNRQVHVIGFLFMLLSDIRW